MEQHKLKILLETVVQEIEAGHFSTLDELVVSMTQAFQEIVPAIGKESG